VESKTILVVDDDPHVREFVRTCLEQSGFSVLLAHDGESAMLLYSEYGAAILMLLLDVSMPKMSGLELADHVLEYDSQKPILFMSGSCLDVSRGFGCLPKPFSSAALIERIYEIVPTQMN
jgi:two-component system, OmpR family, response regulator